MQTLSKTRYQKRLFRWKQTDKQRIAFAYLRDKETTELLFGGGAGGGKTHFGVSFGIYMSLKYKGIRGAFAREQLKSLKESTLLTFFDVAHAAGLREGEDYIYYADSHIYFPQTGSSIYLKEIGWLPSDPQYDRLGSTEYTWVFIDEASQINPKGKNVLRSRIRYKIAENGLVPKLLMSCNPDKGFLYTEFYKPWKDGKLRADRKFVQALVSDNRHIDASYRENLRGLDPMTRERLEKGNWEYDNDPARLMEFDHILDMFSNVLPALPSDQKYITADIARQGNDRTVVAYWEGMRCKRIASYQKLPLVPDPMYPSKPNSAGVITEWREQYGVPISHCIVDEDGVGGGVKDYLGCKGFVNNSRPMKYKGRIPNFTNLKSQCYYELAGVVNRHEISVATENETLRAMLIEEMEQVKRKDIDKDKKLAIVSKEEVKENIGRSPDFSDTLMMRMYFELVTKPSIHWL